MNDPRASDSSPFEISIDSSRPMIRYRMAGLWDEATFALFHEACLLHMRKFNVRGEPFDLLGDLTEFPTQPAKLNERREMLVHDAIALGLRKCGVVTNSQLVKMQLGRLSSQHYAFFTTEAEALAWIEEA
jgi:hypothetical protein